MLLRAREALLRGCLLGSFALGSACGEDQSPAAGASAGSGAAGALENPGGGGGADAGGGMSQGGSVMAGTAGAPLAGTTATGTGGMPCVIPPVLTPSGATIDVTPPAKIVDALAGAKAGDRVLLHSGSYASESVSKLSFESHVFIEAAPGEDVSLAGLRFTSCDHVVIDGVRVAGTLELEGSSDFVLRKVTLLGQGEDAALMFQGQHAAGASHDVSVEDSSIGGGGRTVFILGKFAPSEQWNHHLSFRRNSFECGSHNCFQISGGRDIEIEQNDFTVQDTAGVLTAGATRVKIQRNTLHGAQGSALQIATPGAEWDNYAGVENMISSEVSIANNVVQGLSGVQLDAATNVTIVYNTFVDGVGIRFNHRIPHDQQNNVILNGNSDIRVWNNILAQLTLAQGEMRPSFESNNLVSDSGGGGDNLIEDDPKLDMSMGYALGAGSPAIDAALVNAETPLVDYEGRLRGDEPDLGARELGAAGSACP